MVGQSQIEKVEIQDFLIQDFPLGPLLRKHVLHVYVNKRDSRWVMGIITE